MKKLKIMLASATFLFAFVAAFASKNASSIDAFSQYYVKDGSHCEPTNCNPINTGEACEFNVYEPDVLNQCATPVISPTYRPN
ncbi:DUF6520 family protein [Tamlana sp. 2_MG-2023]|uniref:DUF6520 family protein n=1 Tax=unclassified Tamlana TaxID=2614803 RepID=UPI0026E37187|nr:MULTISPECIES: DUF6520 family protein [unclassified Tamlana]MDO6761882.1 DUF6520 family protein [Tamlana sp. 2_MG-2023]MDO6792644.1 DUF6520 family protein [Tamlana sp. 1_MG-2023]